MDTKIPLNRNECRADKLRPGTRIAAGFLPLMGPAEILFAHPYTLHGRGRVLVVVLYDGDGQPAPDDFLADALIPVTTPPNPVKVCEWDVPGQAPGRACDGFPFCDCPGPDES